jgi:hypothetical protein
MPSELLLRTYYYIYYFTYLNNNIWNYFKFKTTHKTRRLFCYETVK